MAPTEKEKWKNSQSLDGNVALISIYSEAELIRGLNLPVYEFNKTAPKYQTMPFANDRTSPNYIYFLLIL